MIKEAEEKGLAFGVIDVEDCVAGALRDLGKEVRTYGPKKHEDIGNFMSVLLKFMPLGA